MINIGLAYEVVHRSCDFLEQRLRYLLLDVGIVIIRGDKDAFLWNRIVDIRDKSILLYEDVLEKWYTDEEERNKRLSYLVSFSVFNIFTQRSRFFYKLNEIYKHDKLWLGSLRQRDLVLFLNKINSLSVMKTDEVIDRLWLWLPWLVDDWIVRKGRRDERVFSQRIKNLKARGIIDELFSDAYAGLILGDVGANLDLVRQVMHKIFVLR